MIYKKEIQQASTQIAKLVDSTDIASRYPCITYNHMGATIVDSVLQAGLNYKNVVFPRIVALLDEFGAYPSTSDFVLLMHLFPIESIISFNNARKSRTIWELSLFLQSMRIETETQLSDWLSFDRNSNQLLDLYGIGSKTVDYLKKLVGLDSIAIDRHLKSFLKQYGILVDSYNEAKAIYSEIAVRLEIKSSVLDKAIWMYMAENA